MWLWLWLWLVGAACMAQECADREVVHLAGFSGDGYFARAKQTLAKLGLNWKAHDRYTRHGYEDWVMDFEETKAGGRALHHKSSTLVWLEDPLLVWGDSDELERYWELGEGRPSVREYGDSKVFALTQAWKQAAAQAMVCSSSRHEVAVGEGGESGEEGEGALDFHLVLYKDWHAEAYELLVGSFHALHLSHVQTNRFGWVKMALDASRVGGRWLDNSDSDSHNRGRGTVLTNGTTIRILTRNRPNTMQSDLLLLKGFVAVGTVPQRDLQRRVELGWAEQYVCRFLPNGINYVLALDRLGEAGF